MLFLLALEILTASLLLMAILIGLIVRLHDRWVLLFPLLLASLIVCGPLVAVGFIFPLLPYHERYSAVGVCFLLGEIVLTVLALRKARPSVWLTAVAAPTEVPAPTARAAGCNWRVGKLAIAFGLAIVVLLVTLIAADWHMRSVLAKVRVESVRLAAKVAPPPVPDSDNAAPLYQQAFAALESIGVIKKPNDELPDLNAILNRPPAPPDPLERLLEFNEPPGQHNDAAMVRDVEAYLEQCRSALALLRQATAKPACRFDFDYAPVIANSFGANLKKFRVVATILALDARYQAVSGHTDLAMDDINAIYRMAHHVSDPTLIGALVGIAIDALATGTLADVLALAHPTSAQLAALHLGDAAWYTQTLPKSMDFEEATFLHTVATLFAPAPGDKETLYKDLPVDRLSGGLAMFRILILPDDLAGYRLAMAAHRRALQKPYPQAIAEINSFRFPGGNPGLLTAILMPSYEAAIRAAARGDARHALAILGIAAARYQAEHSRDPDKLDQLVPQYIAAIPTDPFDGQPLRMVAKSNEIILYSVGPDLTDNGGREEDSASKGGDVTFNFPRLHAASAPATQAAPN